LPPGDSHALIVANKRRTASAKVGSFYLWASKDRMTAIFGSAAAMPQKRSFCGFA
jgi:hypothetical protein